MMEAGVVIDTNDRPLFWHLPHNRSVGALPDSRELWDVIWEAHVRRVLKGFAHSHPGSGVPSPSYEDITTFRAVERALGRPLRWWIASSDNIVQVITEGDVWRCSPGLEEFRIYPPLAYPWLEELRKHSHYKER